MTDFNFDPSTAGDTLFGDSNPNPAPNRSSDQQEPVLDHDAVAEHLFGTVDVDRGDMAPGDQQPQPKPRPAPQRQGNEELDLLSDEAADVLFGDNQADGDDRDQQQQQPSRPVQIDRGDHVVTDDFANDYNTTAAEVGMDGKQAQKFFDKMMPKVAERQQAAITATQKQWSQESRQHFGQGLDAIVSDVRSALDSIEGGKELGKLLLTTGLGNHRAVLTALAQFGKRSDR